jgi:hypothetical protein
MQTTSQTSAAQTLCIAVCYEGPINILGERSKQIALFNSWYLIVQHYNPALVELSLARNNSLCKFSNRLSSIYKENSSVEIVVLSEVA